MLFLVILEFSGDVQNPCKNKLSLCFISVFTNCTSAIFIELMVKFRYNDSIGFLCFLKGGAGICRMQNAILFLL